MYILIGYLLHEKNKNLKMVLYISNGHFIKMVDIVVRDGPIIVMQECSDLQKEVFHIMEIFDFMI